MLDWVCALLRAAESLVDLTIGGVLWGFQGLSKTSISKMPALETTSDSGVCVCVGAFVDSLI